MLSSCSYEFRKSEVYKSYMDEVMVHAGDFPQETPFESPSLPFPSICKSCQQLESHKPPPRPCLSLNRPLRAFMDDLMMITASVHGCSWLHRRPWEAHQLDMAVLQVSKFQVLVGGKKVSEQFCFSLGSLDIHPSMTALSEAKPRP